MNDNKRKLYDALSNDYDMGTYEQFRKDLEDKDKRRKLYDATSDAYDFGDYDQFEAQLGYGQSQSAPSAEEINSGSAGPVMPKPAMENRNWEVQMGNGHSRATVEKPEPVDVPVPQRPEGQEPSDDGTAASSGDVRSYLENANRQQVANLSRDISSRLDEAQTKSRDIYMKEQEDARKGGFLSTLAHAIAASGHNPEGRSGGMSDAQQRSLQGANSELQSEISKLEAAKKAMSNAEEIIAEADKSVQEGKFPGFFKGVARGFGDKLFDVNTWDMGVSDTKNSIELLKALRKYDEGKPLSESEQMLLDAKSVELATNAYFGSYIGRGYKAGAVTAQSLPFMLEMAVNPASTLGESTQSMLARYALSRFAKKGATRAAQKFATKAAGAAGRALGDIAGSAVMAGTSGAVRVAGDAIDRHVGDIKTDMDGQGQTVFAGHDPESLGKSIAKAFTSTAIENHSEMLGEYFAPALGIVSKLGRKGMEKFGLKNVVDFVDDVSATDAAKLIADFQKRTKWHGTIGEYAEEVAGNIENAILVGDNTLDASDDTGVFNLDQNIDTFLGVALMGGVFSTARTIGWRTPKYRARMEMEEARNKARTKYGSEAWQEIEDRMAEAGDSGMSAVLSTVIAGENSPEKAKALLDYAKSIKKYEGMLAGDEKRREIASPEATDLETSYENGYTLSTPQEVHDAKLMFEYQEAMLQKALGTSDIDIDTIMLGNEMGTLTDEQKSVAMDYLNAKATFDGVIDRVRDDIDSRISSVENAIDASTNRDTGMLQPASLVDDRPVHIISGIVRLTPDGTMVDTRNSENFIIVRDDKTGRMETISPSDINRLENEIDPSMEKQAARQQIQDVYGGREADSIDGVLAFNPGDTYTLTNGQGQSFPVQIVANEQGVADNGDGTVNVILNNDIDTQTGQPRITQMPKEQIQEMAEATNLSRLQQYEQQKLARAAEQAETDATGRTPENPFRINDRITLSDAETGKVENGVVGSELTDDGKYEVVVEKQDGSQSILYLSPSELEQLGARLEQPEAVEERNAPVLEQNQPVLEQKTEKAEQESAMSRIPLDRDGVPQFEQAQPSDTWEALLELNSGNAVEAEDTARQMYENASKNLDKAQKTKPKSGTSVMEIQRNKAERNGQIDELRKSVDFWGKVLSFPEAVRKSASAAAEAEVRQKEDAKREAVRQAKENLAKGRKLMQQKGTYYKDDAKLGDYLDFHDYALRMIANGRVKFVWKNDADNNSIKGLGGHLGLEDSESERKALFSLLANQDKGGLRPDDAAEQLSEEYNSSLGAEVISSSEALDVILDIIRTYGGKTRDMMNAAIDAHAMAGMDERGHDEDNKSSEDKDNSKIAEGQESLPADAPLSNEINEFGVPFIESSDGTTVFGVLTDDSGLSPAPIKLSLGENAADKNGTNHGYGLLHIEAGHGDQIRAAGYSSIKDFVEDVARNYDTIREGGIVANNQTYLLELSDEHNNTLFIQLSRDGSYWNINSAGIFKKKYSRRKPEVFTRPALKTETDTDSGRVDSSRFSGATAPAGNSHQTSEGKDTNISEESNTGSEKSVAEQITEQREVVNTEPTEAQKEAGNYRMGHVKIDGMDVTIENPKGSIRRGTDADGKKWESEMHYDYGYIRGTKAVDNDHIDIFLSDNPETGNVFVVDQVNPKTGEFDESKVMYGFASEQEARDAYLSNYEKGWKGLGKITEVTREEFKKWIESSTRKTKPFSEYASVKVAEAQKEKSIQGLEGYSRDEIKGIVTDHINDVMRDYDIDAEIIGMDIHGSRNRHDARPDSDLDVVVEYSGDIREDDMFNALNGEEDALSIEGIKVDINPIRKEETGDLQDYMKQSEEYDREKSSADNQGNPVNEDSTPAGRAVKEEEKPAEVSAPAETETPKNEGAFGLVSDDRMAELKERLRKKLSGQLNMGIDPEILAIGMELAVGHIDRGVKTFADFSKKMIEDLGDVIRPYLKAFYNGARDLPEVIESGLSAEMTPYDEVRRFNVATIGENGEEKKPTILETAEQVSNELTVQRNADEVEVVVSETENTTNDVYSIAPAQYTTKRGKVLDMFLVKPNDELGTSEQRAANARVREMKGWWDKKAGGFMLRSEEDARQFVEQTFRNPIGTTASANEVQAAKTSLMSDTGSSRDEQEVNAAVGKTFKSKKGLILYVDRIDDGRVFYEITDIDGTTERYDTSIPAMADALQRWEEVTVTDNNNNNETDRTAAEQAAENKQPKNSTKKKKSVSLHTEVDDLFSGLFDEETLNSKDNENGLQRNDAVRSEGLSADGGKHTERLSEGSEKDSGSEPQERSGLNAGRKGTGVEADRSVRPRLSDTVEELAPSEHKNTHNNHSERGENHAPTSIDARIEANIKAIELAQQLIDSGEQATEKQMQVLRKFSGWGGLGKAFSDSLYSVQLQNILGAEAYQDAVMSANSAYYTPAYIVDTLWDIAEQLGFKGGNILEGSAGIGNILGQMPINISERSDIHAIEIDGTSGNILSLLYPDAKVDIQGFEQTRIPNGSVDLAITNVPFVTGLRVNDTTGDKDLSKKFHNIHDFCIAKNVRKLREGGLGIFITSNGTLDNSKQLRDWIVSEGGADFIGAFRMNNKTFGGTGVTSDIIVIRKRMNGRKSSNAIDVSTITGERSVEYDTGDTRKVKGQTVPVIKHLAMDYNRYFVEHPENMAGVMQFAFEQGDNFRPTAKGLYPEKGKNQERMLSDFVSSFKEETDTPAASDESNRTDNGYVSDASADGRKLGELYVKDSKLVVAGIGGYSPLAVNDNKVKGHTKVECFKAYAAIKDALAEVLKYQTENESDSGLKPLLAKLNKAYDDFVSTYGHFNKNTAISFLHNDVDYANVFSLEKYEETGDKSGKRVQKFDKADVFSQRVVEKEKEPNPTNVKDGIIASVFKFGRIDVPYIANQLGRSVEDVKKEIISSGYGFEDPTTKQMELSYQYLSGNVREKLRQAEANNDNGEYDGNIKALQKVIPMDIPAHLIDFTLGSSWITPKLYEDYIKDRTDIDVKLTAAGGSWFMDTPYYVNNEKNRSMGVYSEVLHNTVLGHTLIEAAIQNKTITVSRTSKKWDGTTETITDKDATQACAAKIDEIRQDFKDWARQKMQSDSEMSDEMERIYNDTFNNYVPMSIPDEFVPEYFGGASHKFKMRPHQGKAIVRGTMQPLLLAHEVGTGKTFTLISTAMEMRRLGTARKPMIVVQNATVGQFVASAKELYPNAKILTLEEADRTADGRKNFYAKIRHNDWDMIVVPQSTFEFIPDSEERQMQFVQDKIEEKKAVLENMQDADPRGESMITRQAKKEISDLEAQLAELSESASKKRSASAEKKRAVTLQNAEVKALEMLDRRTDDVENFDDMGIDALLIDEAHEYKHLGFATAMQRGVKGVDSSYSKKSQGVYLKTQAVLENNNGRNVIFATGTPISNTAAEIWTFMRYLMPADTMKEYGIYYFDDFVRNFGNIQQMLEFNTNGKFKESNRFAGYVNLPELVRIWSGISDTVLTKEAGDVKDKIPDIEGGKAQDLYLPQTKALRSIMKFVKSELQRYEQMSGREKKENSHIPLTMYGIAKSAAVDARLVSDAEDDPNSKTNEAVRQTLRSLKETASYKGTVAIFSDNYQNKKTGFNLYDDIRNKLIAQGVPDDEVVVIRPGMTMKKKLEIFDKVNRGEIRVILGSTYTLGTGVNIQERLHTLIHLDAPNRPMDYTQRNGRILRQGNLHKAMGKPVRILRFGVEDSLDVTAYQRLKTKGAIADSIMNGKQMMANNMTNRVLEEEEDVFGDTIAQLSGSEYAMLKNNAEKNVRKFESRKKQWEADQTYIHNAKPKLKAQIAEAEKRAETNRKFRKAVEQAFPGGKFDSITAGKQTFSTAEEMADFFKEHNKVILDKMKQMKEGGDDSHTRELTVRIGDYSFKVRTVLKKDIGRNGGQLFSEVRRQMTYSCPELGLEDVPVYQNLLRNAIDDIVQNVITGKNYAERVEKAEADVKHYQSELKQVESREGVPFEYAAELEQARNQYEEYSELMKKEMEEKEAKYAEMDKDVEAASDISTSEEDDDDDLMRASDTMYRIRESAAPTIGVGLDVEAAAERLAESLGERVRIVRDVNEIENQNKNVQESQRKSKGWFNTRTGEIVVVLPNATGIEDVQATILHEAVGHKGLRELVGDDRFDDFLDKVYAAATKATRLEIVSLARRNHWDFRLATEEYIAGLAEKGFSGRENRTLFGKIKDFFLDMLSRAKIALGFNIGDNELRYMLWRTYQMRTSRGILAKANDMAVQQELKVGNFREDNSSPVSFLKQMQDNAETLVPRQLTKEIWDNEIKGKVFSTPIGVVKLGENQYEKNIKKGRELEFGMLIPTIERPDAIFEEDAPEAGAERQTKYVFVKSFVENGVKKINYASVSVRKDGMEVVASSHYLRDKQMLNKIEKERMLWNRFASGSELSAQGGSTAQSNALSLDANLLKGVKKTNSDEEILSGDDSRLRFRTSGNGGSSNTARDIYEEKTRVIDRNGRKSDTANLMRRLKEAYVDSMQSLKYLQDAISEETGKPVEDFENAYLAENSMSSKNKAQTDIYLNRFFNPIKDAIRDLQKEGAEYGDIVRYLMAKHGLERNEVFSKRDAEKDGGVWDGSVRRDYSGLTELTRRDTDTVAPRIDEITSRAEDIVRKFEMDHDTDVLWEKINAATKDTLRTSYITGMLTKDNYEMVRSMFRYYIPLRGWSENTASAVYDYLSDARPKTSSIVKAATGRTTISDDPIATIAYMGQSAIIQGNRNLMKQKLLNLALNHKTGLLTVSRQWEVLDPVTGMWTPRDPDIPADAAPEQVADIVADFEKDMKEAEKKGVARLSRGKLDTGKHLTAYEGQEHIIKVKRGGIDYSIYLNGNPRAAQAVNGMTNPDAVDSWLIRKARVIKNFMARMFTSQNPAFIISNLSRDVIFAGTAVYAKEDAKYAARYAKNITVALAKGQLIGLIHRFETDRLDNSKDLDRYFGEFIRNGGETGFTQLNTVDDFKRDIDRFSREMKQGQVMKVSTKVWNGIWDGIEYMNRCAEDATRFSVYMTSRQMGRSVERSISDAKEITVNFNRKGSGGFGARLMNFAYIFFNAAVQSLANAGKIMYEHPMKALAALGAFSAAGFMAPLLAQAIISAFGGDDDAYWDLPEWVRRNNFVFYIPWSENKFLIIPISQELRPFYAMGEIAMSVLMGKEEVLDGLKSAAGSFMDLLPIDFMGNGGNLAISLTPTVAQPFAQLVANTDYFGSPIYRRNDYNKLDPAWTKAYKGTSPMLVNASKWLNEVTGGDDVKRGWIDPINNPAVIEHLFESYLGGTGKTINRAAKTFSMIWNPDMRDIRNVPIASTFIQESDDERVAGNQLNREYFKLMDEFKETSHTVSGYKKKARMGSMEYADKLNEFMETPDFERYSKARGYANTISKLRQALKRAQESGEDVMVEENLQQILHDLKRQMVEELKEQ
nr:MAG TPA: Type I restriction enzyme [Caudoviricetes sp.]